MAEKIIEDVNWRLVRQNEGTYYLCHVTCSDPSMMADNKEAKDWYPRGYPDVVSDERYCLRCKVILSQFPNSKVLAAYRLAK